MDKQAQVNEDVTRESLIAISYGGLPHDFITAAENSPDYSEAEKVILPRAHVDGVEICRSNLISISSSTSPDMGLVPLSPQPLVNA